MKIIPIAAKILRVITVPPFLALMLILYLYYGVEGYFTAPIEALLVGLCIIVVPLLAYPISFFVPKFRAGGRKIERSMAFITTGIGYAFLIPVILFGGITEKLSVICLTYVFSVILLIVFNKGLKFKASGHACGVFGPMLVFVYAGGTYMILPCALLSALVIWSSLKLERHTLSELVLGAVCPALALAISFVIFSLV